MNRLRKLPGLGSRVVARYCNQSAVHGHRQPRKNAAQKTTQRSRGDESAAFTIQRVDFAVRFVVAAEDHLLATRAGRLLTVLSGALSMGPTSSVQSVKIAIQRNSMSASFLTETRPRDG
jgi:hypothetical protein